MRAREQAPRQIVGCPGDTVPIVRKLARCEQETFVVVCLDVRNRLISSHVVAIGTVSSVQVHPRDVFREAVRRNAAGIVLGHNHPSGDPTPSADDIELTRRMKAVGDVLGIPVVDHVVVTDGAWRSIAEWMGDAL